MKSNTPLIIGLTTPTAVFIPFQTPVHTLPNTLINPAAVCDLEND